MMSTSSPVFKPHLMRKHLVLAPLLALLGVGFLVAVSIGALPLSPLGWLSGHLSEGQSAVLWSIRLPRVLLGMLVGAALAVSGAVMQGVFRNPLADPGLIGISSGSALAVAVMIVITGPLSGMLSLYGLSIAAFLGGLATCILMFRLAALAGTASMTYLLLAGLAINALSGAATGFLTYISSDDELRAFTFWTMGSLSGALWPSLLVVATLLIPAMIVLIFQAPKLNLLLLGEKEALYLGVNVDKLKRILIFCTALAVGSSVAVSGIIGFVGLVVPHLVRLTLGPDHRLLLPASALLGALLLLLSDTLARTLISPAEMPVGILTSLIGSPFFLWLLIKQYHKRAIA